MDFGRNGATSFDPSLPKLDDRSRAVCGGGTPKDFRIYLGGPIWGIPEWKGSVYPLDVTPKTQLRAYAEQFNSIELNSTFYGSPKPESLEHWLSSVPSSFRFCPKVPKAVSHANRPGSESLERYFELLSALKPRLGLPFLQLSPYRSPGDWPQIESLCKTLSVRTLHAVELRDPSFFLNGQLRDPYRAFFEKHGLTLVITDTPGEREVLHSSVTSPFLFIRFLLTLNPELDLERLRIWKSHISELKTIGLRRVFFFLHGEPEAEIAEPLRVCASELHDLDPDLTPWRPHSLL